MLFSEESGRLRLGWRIAVFGALFVGLHAFLHIALAAVLMIAGMVRGLSPREALEPLRQPGVTPLAVLVPVGAVLSIVLAGICRRRLDGRTAMSMGLGRPAGGWAKSLGGGFLLGVLLVTAAVVMCAAFGGLRWGDATGSWEPLALLPVMFVVALAEEVVCRGYVYRNFLDANRPVLGVTVSAVLFWLLHGCNPGVWGNPVIALNLVGAGVALALAYHATGNLWFATALHLGWNYAEGPLLGTPVSGVEVPSYLRLAGNPELPDWLTGGAFGPEGSIWVTLVEMVLVVALLRYIWGRFYGQVFPRNVPDAG
jgi:membrane protease YdiL (CAAX protease family)